jgi:hypothetical protein
MKVKELIKHLEKLDPEMDVVVDGYETGYDPIRDILQIEIVPTPDSKGWYDGEYQDADIKPISWLQDVKKAVYFPRSSM